MRHADRLASVVCLALGIAAARPLTAQLAEVQPGAKVRIRAPSAVGGRIEGIVATRSRDSLSLTTGQGPLVSMPLAAIVSAEVSRGKSRSDGARRGILWGVPIGVLVMLIPTEDAQCTRSSCPEDLSDAALVGVGVIGGGAWGALIGALVGRERWQELQLTPQVAVGASRRQVALGVAIPF